METIKLLLDRGADVTARDSGERTSLHVAAENSTEVGPIAMLLNKGAAVNVADKDGCTPLHNVSLLSFFLFLSLSFICYLCLFFL